MTTLSVIYEAQGRLLPVSFLVLDVTSDVDPALVAASINANVEGVDALLPQKLAAMDKNLESFFLLLPPKSMRSPQWMAYAK